MFVGEVGRIKVIRMETLRLLAKEAETQLIEVEVEIKARLEDQVLSSWHIQ